jgi:hypothetical protein
LGSAAFLACWCGAAQAYRPFDGTDAAVADLGGMGIELGPVEYFREGAERALFAPNARINYGFTPGWEAVLEAIIVQRRPAGGRPTHDWPVRPVAEIFYDRDVAEFCTRSALVGAIRQVQDNIAVDLGLRGARVNDHTAGRSAPASPSPLG